MSSHIILEGQKEQQQVNLGTLDNGMYINIILKEALTDSCLYLLCFCKIHILNFFYLQKFMSLLSENLTNNNRIDRLSWKHLHFFSNFSFKGEGTANGV